MDQALLNVNNKLSEIITFKYQYQECYKCEYFNIPLQNMTNNTNIALSTNWLTGLEVYDNDSQICSDHFQFNEGTHYEYMIQNRYYNHNDWKYNCTLNCLTAESNSYMIPLLCLLAIVIFGVILYNLIMFLYSKRILQRFASKIYHHEVDSLEDLGRPDSISYISDDDVSLLSNKSLQAKLKKETSTNSFSSNRRRLKSLDTLRGLSLILMVFVNYGGGGYWFFRHSDWNGLTVADLVFPWFVFVMGVTIGVTQFQNTRKSVYPLYWLNNWLHCLRRTFILFLFGIILNSFKSGIDLHKLRIMGVLQRLSISYFVVFSFFTIFASILNFRMKLHRSSTNHIGEYEDELLDDGEGDNNEIPSSKLKSFKLNFRIFLKAIWFDLSIYWPFILVTCGLLIGHGAISKLLRDPNCPVGYLGPGGLSNNGDHQNCTGGVARYIDLIVLGGPTHLYQHPTTTRLYKTTVPYDPEGVLGCMTSCALCFIGFLCGSIIIFGTSWKKVMLKLCVCLLVCAGTGIGLCEGVKNTGFIPINKNLWSVSYVLVTGSMAIFLLMVFFTMIDILQLWVGTPFHVVGMNSIVVYVGHELLQRTFPIQWRVDNNHAWQLFMSSWGTLVWCLVAAGMHYRRIYISI